MKNAQWEAIQPHLEQWAKDVAERLRAMMRHVSQALLKPLPAVWARFFLPPMKRIGKKRRVGGMNPRIVRKVSFKSPVRVVHAEEELEASPAAARPAVASSEASLEAKQQATKALHDFEVGWCHEQKAAWRRSKKEYGSS